MMVPLDAQSTQGAVDLVFQHETAVIEGASLAYPALGSLCLARRTVIGKSRLNAKVPLVEILAQGLRRRACLINGLPSSDLFIHSRLTHIYLCCNIVFPNVLRNPWVPKQRAEIIVAINCHQNEANHSAAPMTVNQ